MSSEAKKHPASDQKLRKQREEGNIANGAEIANVAGTVASLVILIGLAPYILSHLRAAFDVPVVTYDYPFVTAVDAVVPTIGKILLLAVAPVVLVGSVGSIITSMVHNKGVLFSVKAITPKLERISPIAGFKRMFGKRTWVEVGTTLLRLAVWFCAGAFFLWQIFAALFELDSCGLGCTVGIIFHILWRLLATLLILLIILIATEIIIQRNLFLHEQRMTDTEVKKEQKDNFGSNEVRQERQRVRQEDAELAESTGVDKANMCFYFGDMCIAVRYHPEHVKVPQITAKGTSAKKSAALRAKVADNGFPELEHEAVIKASTKSQVGHNVGEEMHAPLIDAMTKLFSRYT